MALTARDTVEVIDQPEKTVRAPATRVAELPREQGSHVSSKFDTPIGDRTSPGDSSLLVVSGAGGEVERDIPFNLAAAPNPHGGDIATRHR